MKTINNILFFSQQYGKSLKKKWLGLLLLFLTPILMISGILVLVVMLLKPIENQPITLGLVDEDQTEESKLMLELIMLTVANNDYLTVSSYSEQLATTALQQDELASVLTLPQGFTEDLYEGKPVRIELVGNSKRIMDSYVIRELVNSLARYIESAQANILTIYAMTKQLDFSKEERKAFMYEQFMNFTMYTLSKDNLLWTEEIENVVTSTPKTYFAFAALFTVQTVWLLGLYSLLRSEESKTLKTRLRLFHVTEAQRMIARALWAIIFAQILVVLMFVLFYQVFSLELYTIDFLRLLLYSVLYSISYLLVVMLIDLVVSDMRWSLLVQLLTLVLVLIMSGAIIPTLYFPLAWQPFIIQLFSNEVFRWLIDITLEQRNYAQYGSLVLTCSGLVLLFAVVAKVKVRWEI